MVTIAEVLDWEPGTLTGVADRLASRRKNLVGLQDEIDDARPSSYFWAAGAGDKARANHARFRSRLNDMVAEVADVTVNLDDAAGRLGEAKRLLEDAVSTARGHGFTVNRETNEVNDPGTYDDEGVAEDARSKLRAVTEDISSALTKANQADRDLAAALTAASKGKVEGGSGSLAEASVQLPESMDDLSQEELIALVGNDIAFSTISAFVEAEVDVASFQLEGKAEGKYVVMADGSVQMSLALEAGLGREISVGGSEAEVSAGGRTELGLKFDSVAEAEAFLAGLDDAAMDFDGVSDFASPGSTVATNVAEYVMKQDVSSFKVGLYGKGSVEVDSPVLAGAAEGRVDAYKDFASGQYGVKVTASVEGDVGGKDSGYAGSAQLEGELKLDKDGQFDEFSLKGEMKGTVLNEKLGLDIPGTSTGQGVDVELKIDDTNPARQQIEAAVARGDMDQAAELAMDNGRVVVRQTSIETLAAEEHDVDLGFAGGAEVKYGATVETANAIWVRQAGTDNLVQLDPSQLPGNSGR